MNLLNRINGGRDLIGEAVESELYLSNAFKVAIYHLDKDWNLNEKIIWETREITNEPALELAESAR